MKIAWIAFMAVIFLIALSSGFQEGTKQEQQIFVPAAHAEGIAGQKVLPFIYKAQEELAPKKLHSLNSLLLYVLTPDYQLMFVGARKFAYGVRSYTQGCSIERGNGSGVNKNYIVTCSGRVLPVLASKQHVRDKEKGWRLVVYTPFSEFLLRDEIIEAGKQYVLQTFDNAFQFIADQQIHSKSYPELLISEINPALYKEQAVKILVNEHTDFWEQEEKGERYTTDKVFALFGANRDVTYTQSVSKAGACCAAQFIKSTFQSKVLGQYPEAGLGTNFRKTMRDPQQWPVAMLLLFDYEMDDIMKEFAFLKEEFITFPRKFEILFPIFYNGGSSRAKDLLRALDVGKNFKGDFPLTDERRGDKRFFIPPVSDIMRSLLREETWGFLIKHMYINTK